MPSFRERPLTWLFWIAAACLDVAALATDHEADFPNALVLGQLFVASGWLIVGRVHRLARAGVLVTTIALLTMPDFIVPRLRGGHYGDLVWPHIAALYMAMSASTALWTWLWLTIARGTSSGARRTRPAKWQFPLAEVFGWMIIVAVGSVGARRADFSLLDDPKGLALAGALTAVAGAIMALGIGAYGRGTKVRAILAAGFLILFVGSLVLGLSREELAVAVGALAFVGVWVVVQRLDARAMPANAEGDLDPPIRLHSQD